MNDAPFLSPPRTALIGFCSGLGARDPGCGDGPEALRMAKLEQYLHDCRIDAYWAAMLYPQANAGESLAATVARLNERLAKTVNATLRASERPLVLGGDHSCAVGTWRGVYSGMDNEALGLLWIDAHMDAHTPESSHSGLLHGMPLAALLGYCGETMPPCAAALRPQHVCIVGARSHEPEEEALLAKLGVRVYRMDEIEARGLDCVLREAQTRVMCDTHAYGISVDVDAIDPQDAPGVGTPAEGGLRAQPLTAALDSIVRDAPPIALEIAEFNPHADRADATLRLVGALATALGGAPTVHPAPHIAPHWRRSNFR